MQHLEEIYTHSEFYTRFGLFEQQYFSHRINNIRDVRTRDLTCGCQILLTTSFPINGTLA